MCWKKGGLIMEAKPYALVILNNLRQERCNFCLRRTESLLKCGACKKVWYCGCSCQMNKSSLKLETTESPCLRSFIDLKSHAEDIKDDEDRYELFKTASDFVKAYSSGIVDLPKEDVLLDFFGKMVINTFTVANEMLQDVAVAVYNSPSILDHRCRPNAVASFIGRSVMIRAVEDIKDKDYTKVYLSYLDPLASVTEKQQMLKEQYYFTCHCDRCHNMELNALMTNTAGSMEGNEDEVKECLDFVHTKTKEKANPQDMVTHCQKCLSNVSLPSTNVHLVRLISKAYDAAIDGEMWNEAAMLGRRNLLPFQQLNPPYTTSVGYMLANLGKLLVFLEEVHEARNLLRQAIEILLVCLGNQHSLVHQVKELIQQCDMELASGANSIT